uniref:Enoyl-CoA hydratase/isomerase family protein n=1 Tax=Thermorudis peleae TaxID=1382356 RepID=A0A831T8T6_9BACT
MSVKTAGQFKYIEFTRQGRSAIVRLAHPEDGNALSTALLAELAQVLTLLDDASVLLLCASGPDFSLGRPPASYGEPLSSLQQAYQLVVTCNERLANFPGISISAVQGRAMGAGCSLACRCDLVLAAETARFSFPELRKGVPPVIVAAYYSKRLPWRAFLDMVLTGREVPADEAVRLGLVSRVVPDHVLDRAAIELAGDLAAYDPNPVRQLKTFLRDSESLTAQHANRLALSALLDSLARQLDITASGGGE